jgi:hypothetical protein
MRRDTRKLLQPQQDLVLAWAGFKDVAQAMALSLQEQPLDLSLPRSKVAQAARERFRQVREDRDVEHRSDANEFILSWFCRAELKPVALHLLGQGAAVWVEQWQYAGNPSAVATARTVEAAVAYLEVDDLEAPQLSLIALKVLRDAIVAAPPSASIGGKVKLATVTAGGVHILEVDEIRAGNDALDVWQERCAELLPGAGGPPASAGQIDRGLLPPT